MAKSQQTYNKSEKEKKRLKKRELKKKKMDARKLDVKENGTKGIEFAYVDHDGNLTDTPPDPTLKVEVDIDDIILGIPKKEASEEYNGPMEGRVDFFDTSKGFGFIINTRNQEKYFVHVSQLIDSIEEGNKVTFELEQGLKGMNAVKVQKI